MADESDPMHHNELSFNITAAGSAHFVLVALDRAIDRGTHWCRSAAEARVPEKSQTVAVDMCMTTYEGGQIPWLHSRSLSNNG